MNLGQCLNIYLYSNLYGASTVTGIYFMPCKDLKPLMRPQCAHRLATRYSLDMTKLNII